MLETIRNMCSEYDRLTRILDDRCFTTAQQENRDFTQFERAELVHVLADAVEDLGADSSIIRGWRNKSTSLRLPQGAKAWDLIGVVLTAV